MAVMVTVNTDVDIIQPGSDSPQGEIDYMRRAGDAYHRAAQILTVLSANGWLVEFPGLSPMMRHPDVRTPAQARKQVSALGIDPKMVIISRPLKIHSPRRAPSRVCSAARKQRSEVNRKCG
ncbi:MAG: hypothetical protein K8U57_02035 [Planctomycetes bacterium]|nr:hypothetical protein [Planctomycetota bacterium]